MTDKQIEQILYNFENIKEYLTNRSADIAEASAGTGVVQLYDKGQTSSVEHAVLEIEKECEDLEVVNIIRKVLKKPKFAEYYCCRYVRKEGWKESRYSRRTYYRRKKELINEIRGKINC